MRALSCVWCVCACLVTAGVGRAGEVELDELAARRALFAAARGPRRIAALLPWGEGLAALDDASADGGQAVLAFLREAVARADDPLVEARARVELAHLLDRRGRRGARGPAGATEAAAVRAPLGLVGERAIAVGPFVHDGGAELGAEVALAVEAGLVAGTVAQDATWPSGGADAAPARARALPTPEAIGLPAGQPLAGGAIPLGAVLRPETHVVAYLVFGVRSAAPRAAVLRVGSTGAVVAWLNGRRLGGHVGDRPLALDADAYPAPLAAGDNRFVVRVATSDRQPELILRLTDPAGRGVAGLAAVDPWALVGHAPPHAQRGGGGARSLRVALDAEAKRDAAAGVERDAYLALDAVDGPSPDGPCARARPRSRLGSEVAYACAREPDERRRAHGPSGEGPSTASSAR